MQRTFNSLFLLFLFLQAFILGRGHKSNAVFIAFMEVATIICCYYFHEKTYQKAFKRFKFSRFSTLFILWLTSILVSFVLSPYSFLNWPDASLRYVCYLVHIFFIYFFSIYLQKNNKFSIQALQAIALSGVPIILYNIVTFIQNIPLNINSASLWLTQPLLFTNIRHIGYNLCCIVPLLGLFIFRTKSKLAYAAYIFSYIVSFAFMWWLSGRASIGATFIAIFILFVFMRRYRTNNTLLAAGVLLLSTTAAVFVAEYFGIYDWNGFTNMFDETSGMHSSGLTSGRTTIWLNTIDAIKTSPWFAMLFGLGSQIYLSETLTNCCIQPHNVILQFILEWGIVGSLLFFSLFLIFLWNNLLFNLACMQQSICWEKVGGAMIILAISSHAMLDGTFYHAQPLFYLSIGLAIWRHEPHI